MIVRLEFVDRTSIDTDLLVDSPDDLDQLVNGESPRFIRAVREVGSGATWIALDQIRTIIVLAPSGTHPSDVPAYHDAHATPRR